MLEEIQTKFKTIMIIEDNPIDLYISSRVILKNNFTENLLKYSSAQLALDYLIENQDIEDLLPNLILIDIHMPIMTGFEFMDIYNLFSAKLKKNCEIYVLSSTIDELDIKKVDDDTNIKSFHEKPITKEFLESI
jgi:CheY-like chemotaxis protein